MTLEDAIEEVKRCKPGCYDKHVVAIINAVASGQLVTKAYADLAVAEALRKAGEAAFSFSLKSIREPGDVDAAILALANQDHLAEVQALRKIAAEAERVAAWEQARAEAAEAEVARLKNLLGRYSDHVGDAEGTDFLGDTYDSEFIAYPSDHLTEAECREIRSYSPHWAALTPKGDTP